MPGRLRWRMPANRHQRSADEGDVGRPVEREQVTHPIPEHQRHVVALHRLSASERQATCDAGLVRVRESLRMSRHEYQPPVRPPMRNEGREQSIKFRRVHAARHDHEPAVERAAVRSHLCREALGHQRLGLQRAGHVHFGHAKFTQAACAGRVFAERKRKRFEEDAAQPRNTGITRRRARAEAPAHQHYRYPCSAGTPDKPGP